MYSYLTISIKSLLLNRVRSFLTVLGIIIGVGAVIILTSIVGGLQKTITDQFQSFGSNNLFLFPGTPGAGRGPGGAVVNKLKFDTANRIKRLNGVIDVAAEVISFGKVKYRGNDAKAITINGVEDNYLKMTSLNVTKGSFISRGDQSGGALVTVIGQTVADTLFKNIDPLNKQIIIKDKRFTVIGIMQKRGAIFGQDQDNQVYIPLSVSRERFQIDRPNFFFIKVDKPEDVKPVQREVIKLISQDLDKEDFSVVSQEQGIDFITKVLGVLAIALGGIAAISLLVGGVGIMNIMFVSVTERTREIGLRKAVGATSANILTQFLFEAIILSLIGGLLGVLFGITMSLIINNFVATVVNLLYVFLSFGVSAAIGIIFGVAPAIKASQMDPIVALRYE